MSKKIIFMGTPLFAVPILKSLYQNGYPISVVYTQPPQKAHRGQSINKSPIQEISETLSLDYRLPKTLKDNDQEFETLNLLPKLVEYATREFNIQPTNDEELDRSSIRILRRLKSEIARQFWNEDGFYKVYNRFDQDVKAGIQSFAE